MNKNTFLLCIVFFPLVSSAGVTCRIAEAISKKFETMSTSATDCEKDYEAKIVKDFQEQLTGRCIPLFKPMVSACSQSLPAVNTSNIQTQGKSVCSKYEAAGQGVSDGIDNITAINEKCDDSIVMVVDTCVPLVDAFIKDLEQCTRQQVDKIHAALKQANNGNQLREQFCGSVRQHAKNVKAEFNTHQEHDSILNQYNSAQCHQRKTASSKGQ